MLLPENVRQKQLKKEELLPQVCCTVNNGRESWQQDCKGCFYHTGSREAERKDTGVSLAFSFLLGLRNLVLKKDAMNTQGVFAHISLH